MRKQTVLVDIPVDIPNDLKDLSQAFTYALWNISSLYQLQLENDLSVKVENGIWHEIPKSLRLAQLPLGQKNEYEQQIQDIEKGIFDLYPITVKSKQGEIDLIIGKVFASEGDSVSYYSGVAGVVNDDYTRVIDKFDSQLDRLCLDLLVIPTDGSPSLKSKAPEIKCLDVFSLAGGLDVSHKPICVFFSGKSPENISSLSNMTVFLNLYTARFRALTVELAKRYIVDGIFLADLSDSDISKLLLIWLRGHDIGHFIGEDKLGESMSEFDTDYMILHELKSDLIALYSFKLYSENLLTNGLLEKIYYLSVSEMLRYIRRGNVLKHPDSASAYFAWCYFEHLGALKYDTRKDAFNINIDVLENSVNDLTNELLEIFKTGDTERARQLVRRFGSMETSNENDLSPRDCSENLRRVINDADIAFYIDYNFITDKHSV